MAKDRFEKISDDYAHIWPEVVEETGGSDEKLQESIFKSTLDYKDLKNATVLDLGTGDGNTIYPFYKHGCANLTGLDLNPVMLQASEKRFEAKVKLIQADMRDLSFVKEGEFQIIISGYSIHNLTIEERYFLWNEIIRIRPQIFVNGDKIADPDPDKHNFYYSREVEAIRKVYFERHNLKEVYEEWVEHYEYDEEIRLELEEIKEALGKQYRIEVAYEYGMAKTVKCTLFD